VSHARVHRRLDALSSIPSQIGFVALIGTLLALLLADPVVAQVPGAPAPVPQIDPYAQMEVDRVNRENYSNYRDYCGKLKISGQLERAIECYGQSAKRALQLGFDSMAVQDEQKQKEAQAELDAQREKQDKARQKAQQVTSLVQQAENALGRGEVIEARKAIGEALTLDPANRAAQVINRLVQDELKSRLVARVVTWSVLGTLAVAALGAGFVWIRRSKRVSTLEMIEGPQPGDVFRLEKETTVIGALEKEADWPIADLSRRVSRRHCEITRSGNRYFLVDVSTNGTWINGRPAPANEPVLLRRGDLIAIADDVVLRFR
jgi:predicted component of type VI protein secretion system